MRLLTWALSSPCSHSSQGSSRLQVSVSTGRAAPHCEHCTLQEELLERYRELVGLVAGLDCGLEEHSYNYLHTWAAAALGEVRP